MNYKYALFSLVLAACSSQPLVAHKPTNPNPNSNSRKVSSEGVVGITSRETLLYSWTNNPQALSSTAGYIKSETDFAQGCLPQIAKSKRAVPKCEGNGMTAGPGFYTVDNPFTSHDYGSSVVIVPAIAGDRNVINVQEFSEAGTAVDREDYGNAKHKAIAYIFRASDFNTNALVVRDLSFLNTQQAQTIPLNPNGFKKLDAHATYTCNSNSSIIDILQNWGDHMDYMSLVFFSLNDDSGNRFVENNQLNTNALLAVTASDAVAISDKALAEKIKTIQAVAPDTEESFVRYACTDTGTVSPRACLARRVFDSARNDMGFGQRPTYAWELPTALKAFVILDILTTNEAEQIKDSEQLKAFLSQKARSNTTRLKNAQEAFRCVQHYKAQLEKNHLGLWN
ncbi:hypothetical protein [Bdellovibrio sp. HCB337]|uniref:hypothetical protein n=1 Tax=Bdellovibrio sp. HCB337 TaxID=3394358 RepID=UPI0039A5AE8D